MKVGSAHNSRRSPPAVAPAALAVPTAASPPPRLRPRPAFTRSRPLAAPWNFVAASLYNAAMLPRPRAAASTSGSSAEVPAGARRLLWALAPVALFSSMALASTAHAQAPTTTPEQPAKAKSGKQPAPVKKGTTLKKGNKVIAVDEEFLVEGRLEKPSAFYVLRRSSTDYDWARLDAVFTPLVLESVQDPLF